MVMGRAEAGVDRTPYLPELFDCDVCGQRLKAGLRGFDVYARCEPCAFDVCLDCLDNKTAAQQRQEKPTCRHHPHTLTLVDRNDDDDEDTSMPSAASSSLPRADGDLYTTAS